MINSFVFIDESGILDCPCKTQPYFSVGLLKLSETGLITEKLIQRHYDYFSTKKEERRELFKNLKENKRILSDQDLNLLLLSTRHHEYKFTNITHTTLDRYKSFIDTAFNFPVYFCALVIDKTDSLFNSSIYRNYWQAYIKYSKILSQHNCLPGEQLCIVADYMNKPNDSEVCFEDELNKMPIVFNTLRAHSETFMLIQVCDLLLGSVSFQWRKKNGYIPDSNRAKAKELFVDYLLEKLNLSQNNNLFPLAGAITIRKPHYFSVWPLKLSNIKNGGV